MQPLWRALRRGQQRANVEQAPALHRHLVGAGDQGAQLAQQGEHPRLVLVELVQAGPGRLGQDLVVQGEDGAAGRRALSLPAGLGRWQAMRVASLILPILCAAAMPAAAQVPWNPAAPENRQVLPTFNYATVESVLASIGARAYPWLADWLNSYVVKQHPAREALRQRWMRSDHPWLARAGWSLTAERVNKDPNGLDLQALLDLIEN